MQKEQNNDRTPQSDKLVDCEGILPDHCEELKVRKFSNDPKHLFIEIKTLEDRYEYTLQKMRDKMATKVKLHQQTYLNKYRNTLSNKRKEINEEIKYLEAEVEKNLEALISQEITILKEIELIYKENSPELVEDVLKILEMD